MPNIDNKSALTQKLFIVFLLFLGVCNIFSDLANAEPVRFSEAEKSWLQTHPQIRVAPDPDFPPIEWFDEQGNFTGIAAEYLSLVEKSLGIKFKIVQCQNWDEVLAKARNHEVDFLSAAAQTPGRAEYLLFSSPHIVLPGVIITRKEKMGELNLEKIRGLKVSIVSGYVWQEFISRDFPGIMMDIVPDVQTGLKHVSFGQSDVFIENLATATYTIEKEGITNLRVAGETGYFTRLSFATRKDWPELNSILEKALLSVSPEEKKTIYQKWIRLDQRSIFQMREFWIALLIFAAVVALAVALFFAWNHSLRRQVAVRTAQIKNELAERKKVELALRESESKYRFLFEESPAGALVQSPDGIIIDISRSLAEALGYTREEMLGKSVGPFVVPEQRAEQAARLRRRFVNEQHEQAEVDTIARDGSTHTMLFSGGQAILTDASGNKYAVLVAGMDITGRKATEHELRNSQERYRFLFEESPAGSFIISPDGRILDVNAAMMRMLGYEKTEVVGRPAAEFIAEEKRAHTMENILRRFAGEIVPGEDVPIIAKNGTTHTLVFARGQAIVRDNNRVTGLLLCGTDVTEQRKAEETARRQREELIRTDKLASLGILVSGVAHEINNPNNFIILNGDNLRDIWKDVVPVLDHHGSENSSFTIAGLKYAEVRDEVPQLIAGISEGAKRIRAIVQSLKDFARQGPGDINRPVNLNAVIEQANIIIGNLIKKSTDRFAVAFESGLPEIRGDFQRIEQVVINLITNACQALNDRKQAIEVRTRFDREKNAAVITVRDEGIGIPQENLKHIMDPFFTTKRDSGGTGLGLAISYGIVNDHAGQLTIDSAPGEGTAVSVSFPVLKGQGA